MKKFLVLLPLFVFADGIVDLGVIGPRSMIMLEKCERRKDFAGFRVEVLPQGVRENTNKISFFTTNSFLTLNDLKDVPTGRALLGIRQHCWDSSVSAVQLFAIDVQRDPPSAPRASVAQFGGPGTEEKIEDVIQAQESTDAVTPPMPMLLGDPRIIPEPSTNNTTQVPVRLPGGTNQTYIDHLLRLERAQNEGRRRSQ